MLLKRPKRNVETFLRNRSQLLKSTNEIYNNDIGSYKHVKTQKKTLWSSWSRLLNYITTISCHNDESAAVVVADDASSSSLLLLLSAAGHNASVWAPIEWLTAVIIVMYDLMRLSFSMFHFFFGRRTSPRFQPLLVGAALSTPAFSAPPSGLPSRILT